MENLEQSFFHSRGFIFKTIEFEHVFLYLYFIRVYFIMKCQNDQFRIFVRNFANIKQRGFRNLNAPWNRSFWTNFKFPRDNTSAVFNYSVLCSTKFTRYNWQLYRRNLLLHIEEIILIHRWINLFRSRVTRSKELADSRSIPILSFP